MRIDHQKWCEDYRPKDLGDEYAFAFVKQLFLNYPVVWGRP
jgi:hypothetical protein